MYKKLSKSIFVLHECGLVQEMLKSARYHIDRAEIVVLPQKGCHNNLFIQEESSGGTGCCGNLLR